MQHKGILTFAAILCLASCSRSNFYEHQSLSFLPADEHNKPIELYFDGKGPTKDYIEYYNLRIVRKGSFNDQQMVRFLKEEARKKGLDAIADIKKWDELEEKKTLLDVIASATDEYGEEYTTTVNYSIIEGKGIKFLENIDLTKSIKQGNIYNTTTDQLIGQIDYLPNGLISETTSEAPEYESLLDTYFRFSESHLLYEEENWQTLHHPDGRVDVRRLIQMNDWLQEKVRVRYFGSPNDRIRQIKHVQFVGKNAITSHINYAYNDSGQLVKRAISGPITNFTEHFNYNSDQLQSITIEYGEATYRIDLAYYQQENLEGLVRSIG